MGVWIAFLIDRVMCHLPERAAPIGRYPFADVLARSVVPAALEDLWVGPFVGGRLCWDLNEKLAFGVGGDVGGFEIGPRSV